VRPPPRPWDLHVERLLEQAFRMAPGQGHPELRDEALLNGLLLWQVAQAANRATRRRLLTQAGKQVSLAVRRWPWSIHAVLTRAWIRLALSRLTPALRDFDLALHLEPDSAVALMGRARTHAQLAARARSPFDASAGFMFALADVEEFSLNCPDGSDSASERGLCFFQKGISCFQSMPDVAARDLEAAADNFEAALLAHAGDADRHVRLVEALAWRVLLDGAEGSPDLLARFRSAYEAAVARGADEASMHADAGFAFAQAGRFNDALRALQQARRLRPRDRSLREMVAQIEAAQRGA
jgi:tetratricopeptide (TPR) repeat protein